MLQPKATPTSYETQPQRQVKQTEIWAWTNYLGHCNWLRNYWRRMEHLPSREGTIRYIRKGFVWYVISEEPTTSFWSNSLWHAWRHKANWYWSGGLQLNPWTGWIISKPQHCYWRHRLMPQETRWKTVPLDSSWGDTHLSRGEENALHANPKDHTRVNTEDQDQLNPAMRTKHSTGCCNTNRSNQDYEYPNQKWWGRSIQPPVRLYE